MSPALSIGVRLAAVLTATLCICGQEPATQSKDVKPKEAQGLPPRASPGEYQFQAKAGTVTIAGEFAGHAVSTAQGPLSTEDYVTVEVAFFGPPEARLQLSVDDFSLRLNGKKTVLRSQPYGLVLSSLKDPEWSPPEAAASGPKSKTGISTGGGGEKDSNSPPPVVHIPIQVQRAMAQRTQKAALASGDRALPQAGLLFFQYRGKTQNLSSIELMYSGPAGKATLTLR
jgi:hypothetical protein